MWAMLTTLQDKFASHAPVAPALLIRQRLNSMLVALGIITTPVSTSDQR